MPGVRSARITVDLEPNNSATIPDLAPGNYTLTAETEGGEPVQVNGDGSFEFTVDAPGPTQLQSVTVTTENVTLAVQNPNEVTVTATVENDSGDSRTLDVAAEGSGPLQDLDPGTYTITATAEDSRSVLVNGSEEHTVELAGQVDDEQADDTQTPTETPTPTPTETPTETQTPTPTETHTPTSTPAETPTPTETQAD